ncbi:MAG: hypothetical protein HBSAPP03_11660 [Phycisphaerae bacterium]|nr:MAG: hypothetical protein HBSAPP03_11660 [Phycisphaerae bacterium]
MEFLTTLWLPIVLSAVICFVASSIIWMATPLHKHDYKNPGDKEDAILSGLKSWALSPGVYFVPWMQCDKKLDEAAKKAAMERAKTSPRAMIIVHGGDHSMGKMLGMWFVHLLITGVFVAYVASHAGLGAASYLKVFQVVGAVAFLAHAGYALPLSIWHGLPWSQLPGRLLDGLIYALLTAGTFAWQMQFKAPEIKIPGL